MQDRGLLEFKSFFGNLQAGSDTAPITFRARIDGLGKVEFDFGEIILTKGTSFIRKWWGGEGSRPGYFLLSGEAEDGTQVETVDLHFTSLGNGWSEKTGGRMRPVGGCSRAEFRRKLATSTPKTELLMRVKGFQNLRQLTAQCCLGTVSMDGESSSDDPDNITGYIAVQSDNEPADLTAWHAQANELLEHIRRVMSFASATVLKGPIIEFYAGDDLKVVALTQTRQASAPFRTFPYNSQQPFFNAAVTFFFCPPFEVKNLFFAIEWFSMEATYKEVGLVNAMTALENLIVSNLNESDRLIQPIAEFKILRKVLKQRIEKWSTDEANIADGIVGELDEKLAELKRRSLLNNLMTLTQRWSVPLDGIGKDKIIAAKKARDFIVHQGQYSNGGNDVNDDLWEHVMVIREIVVRFLLTAIGYRGGYFSYIGGCHDAQFPPQADDKNAKQSTPQQATGY